MKNFFLTIAIYFASSLLYSQQPPPPILGPGEYWTNLWSVSYDYQGNGSIRYIVQDPAYSDQWCAISMAQQDSNTAAGIQRYIYYSYSTNNGYEWTANVLDASTNFGFPDLSLKNGDPIIACNRNSPLSCVVYKEIIFGAFSFEVLASIPTNINCSFPKIAGITNGNVVLGATSNFRQFCYSNYNGSSWSPWQQLSAADNSSGTYTVSSNSTGRVSIFTMDYNLKNAIKIYNSFDNGITFDNGTIVFNYFIDGNDTLYANVFGGLQAVYKDNEPHLVFTTFKYRKHSELAHTLVFTKPKILHWSPGTGVIEIAGKNNIPTLADAITTSSMATLCQPSLGITANGKIRCSFTAFLTGNVQVVDDGAIVNAGEIFISESVNDGSSWSTPFNITYTPAIEEKYSSLSAYTATDSFRIFFIRDLKAGNWAQVPEWGKAPVYGIFKKYTIITNSNINEPLYKLSQNYPNPFNPKTIINYEIPLQNKRLQPLVQLKVYNVLGNEVAKLINQKQSAINEGKRYSVEFDGSNFPSGIYYYKLFLDGALVDTKKMILLK